MTLSIKSLNKLIGVDPRLVSVIKTSSELSPIHFEVTEGVRSFSRQKMLFDAGKSQTMSSRHLTGDAVDLVILIDGVAHWEFNSYRALSEIIKKVAIVQGVDLEWGGDFPTFKDGVHFQLKRKVKL